MSAPEPSAAEQFGRNVVIARRRLGHTQEILASER